MDLRIDKFTILEALGKTKNYFLNDVNDANTILTDGIKSEILTAFQTYLNEKLCKVQINEMRKGLLSVIPNFGKIPADSVDKLFFLISGTNISIEDWKRLTKYKNGYTCISNTIVIFWKVLGKFDSIKQQSI